jgi:hypothetical protein
LRRQIPAAVVAIAGRTGVRGAQQKKDRGPTLTLTRRAFVAQTAS